MRNDMEVKSAADLICRAIVDKHRISFTYHHRERVGEPQCFGVSKTGKEIVRIHLIKGGSRPEQLFTVSEMQSVKLLAEHFTKPGPNYKPNDTAMAQIYCQINF